MVCSALQCAAGTAKGGSPLAPISPASDFREVLDPTDIITNLPLLNVEGQVIPLYRLEDGGKTKGDKATILQLSLSKSLWPN